ncbi:uroporphyrinogen-III synthase [Candidatus Microthrix sp.]|uniref:uroporphyrinogen-III synthase n=1 Tax=Candidatus Neomicrothrix sp. TaxID=2719034 RepID=UPI001B68557F|nr:uroporphyrinogen-III synthase [Candidatus Microthrix sp.]MBP7985742.1 uroporphyrinogen-III synthase [Candidatus Microthrix sp.]
MTQPKRPLDGRTVVVTRAEAQSGPLIERLESLGACSLAAPCIATEPPADGGAALRAVVGRLGDYASVVLTSPNGARALVAACKSVEVDRSDLDACTFAAVGPGTAEVLCEADIVVDLVPEDHVGEGLLAELGDPQFAGAKVLIVRAEVARNVLPQGLIERGWEVDVVPAYRTVTPPPNPELAGRVGRADAITFTSSSTVTGFLSRFGGKAVPRLVVCIGPIAADTARRAGFTVDAVARPHSLDGLVSALIGLLVAPADVG